MEMDSRCLKQGTKEWLAARTTMACTASEFSSVCNRNYFRNRTQLMREKTHGSDFHGNEATRWGQAHEPDAIARFEKDHPGRKVRATGLWKHPTHPRIGGSPDGLVVPLLATEEVGIVEVKCPFSKRHLAKLPRHKKCPAPYVDQIQGMLEIMGLPWCVLVVWNPQDVVYVKVPRDRTYWATRMAPAIHSFVYDLDQARAAAGSVGPDLCGSLALSAGDFSTCCRRNIFKTRRALLEQKLRSVLWRERKARRAQREEGEGKGKKKTRTWTQTTLSLVSFGPPKKRAKKKKPRRKPRPRKPSVESMVHAVLPAELQDKVYKLHHEMGWSKVMRQLGSLVIAHRGIHERQIKLVFSRPAFVRAVCGPLRFRRRKRGPPSRRRSRSRSGRCCAR